ncbi:hypothetical protein LJC14_00505 [Treponema sp. OttesenSCG-928-L16]|nr:hypothetical protein [Treponema sp. OttesenSCG-928-L16]
MGHKHIALTALPRTAYSLFILDLPRLGMRERVSAAENRLETLYPGDLNHCCIALKKNGRKKSSCLVFVLDKAYAQRALSLPTLLALAVYGTDERKIIVCGDTWLEFIRVSGGGISQSAVRVRREDTFAADMAELFAGESEAADILCHDSERDFFAAHGGGRAFRFRSLDKELGRCSGKRISLFYNQRPGRARRRAAGLLLFCLLCAAALLLAKEYYRSYQTRTENLRLEAERTAEMRRQEAAEARRLDELRRIYQAYAEGSRAGPYETAALIARCLPADVHIVSASFREGFFQFEGTASDALAALAAFEECRQIRSPRIQQVVPEGSRERFTMDGTVMPLVRSIDTNLSAADQIVLLEEYIQGYEAPLLHAPEYSASQFGEQVKKLLQRWQCRIHSYRYLHTGEGWEIEFSLSAGSGSFFQFLKEASSSETAGFQFTLIQIRNLYPRNSLDITARLKSAKGPEDGALIFCLADDGPLPEEFPAEAIASHYYRAPQPRLAPAPDPLPAAPEKKAERVSWLEYVGRIGTGDGRYYTYVKNKRDGSLLKLEESRLGNMGYRINGRGSMEAVIDGVLYEIRK